MNYIKRLISRDDFFVRQDDNLDLAGLEILTGGSSDKTFTVKVELTDKDGNPVSPTTTGRDIDTLVSLAFIVETKLK